MKEKSHRISEKKRAEIREKLSAKEHEILKLLAQTKWLTSRHIKRIFFAKRENELAATRAANRTLKGLAEFGLIEQLPRSVGGRAGGSGVNICQLSAAGLRLMKKNSRKSEAGSSLFLEHTLMMSEVYTRFCEWQQAGKLELLEVAFEPLCWRNFARDGDEESLKPDLLVKVLLGGYEDSYFLEIDRDTEREARLLAKCKTYVAYYNSGIEQRLNEIFPFVVWLVLDEKRREKLERIIREKLPRAQSLFQVITLDELEALICGENTASNNESEAN